VIVDTVSNAPINIRLLVKDIRPGSRKRRGSGRTGKSTQASSRSLDSVLGLAALELGLVDDGSNGGRGGVDTNSIGVVLGTIGIKRVGSIHSNGRSGGGRGQHGVTLAAGLRAELGVAACELSGVSRASLGKAVVGSTPSGFVVAGVSGVVQDREVAFLSAERGGGAAADDKGVESDAEIFHC
jgi:hypothetical protein